MNKIKPFFKKFCVYHFTDLGHLLLKDVLPSFNVHPAKHFERLEMYINNSDRVDHLRVGGTDSNERLRGHPVSDRPLQVDHLEVAKMKSLEAANSIELGNFKMVFVSILHIFSTQLDQWTLL